MALNSLVFIYGFLPLALILFYLAGRVYFPLGLFVLISASVAFYAIGDPSALPFLVLSLLCNFALGFILNSIRRCGNGRAAKVILGIGIASNVFALALCKYAPLLVSTPWGTRLPLALGSVVAPLAISFLTFSQISYLIEIYTQKIEPPNFLKYCLYVLFFPKLIAGPIARPSEILSQFSPQTLGQWDFRYFSQGISFLAIGLFKKAVIADQLARVVAPIFVAATKDSLSFYRAWFGAITYGFQIYFDFSGYTDMAIGSALLFGIFLPLNFENPYGATSITDFWRRWHITLSSFLRDYIYIPLGGSRHGYIRKLINLMIVMILCGIWHGAGLTFFVWGALHGAYLVIHNLWMSLRKSLGYSIESSSFPSRILGWGLTFTAVTISWVFFRAESIGSAFKMIKAMAGWPHRLPTKLELIAAGVTLLLPAIITWLFPTSQRWLRYQRAPLLSSPPLPPSTSTAQLQPSNQATSGPSPAEPLNKSNSTINGDEGWNPNFWRGLLVGFIALLGLLLSTQVTDFVYGGF